MATGEDPRGYVSDIRYSKPGARRGRPAV